MATSVYFNNYNSIAEQRVVEDLIVESIKIMGFDAYYLPIFNSEDRDILYGEDPVKKFKQAFPVEFYLSSSLEYNGEKEFFSKFGLEIKNHTKVVISRRTFAQRVPQNTFQRPREGDLVYIPFLNGTGELYEITFADQDKEFHTLGRVNPYFYELHLEKFKYSNEVIDTGVVDIDDSASLSTYQINLTNLVYWSFEDLFNKFTEPSNPFDINSTPNLYECYILGSSYGFDMQQKYNDLMKNITLNNINNK